MESKSKCTKPVWHEIGQALKEQGFRTKIEDKKRWRECSQKWSNLQKWYKYIRASEKRSGAAASEAWPYDGPIDAILGACCLHIGSFFSLMKLLHFSLMKCFHFYSFNVFRRKTNDQPQDN